MFKIGDQEQIEIKRVTGDGKGVGFSRDGLTMFYIEGVTENDHVVKVEITKVFESTVFAQKKGAVKGGRSQPERRDVVDLQNSPYELDDEEDDEDDEE